MKIEKLEKLIMTDIRFPTLPAVAVQILQAVSKDDTALRKLGEIISVDPALSAKMLKVANSGLFYCTREISSMQRAMAVLGLNTIKSLALSFLISDDLCKKNHPLGFSFDDFWRRAVTSAVAAELLSKHCPEKTDDIFLIALLQNLGVLVMLLNKQEEYLNLLENELEHCSDLSELEKRHYGYDHQQVTGVLFKRWNFPEAISEPIYYHHQPESAPQGYRHVAEILYLSDMLGKFFTQQGCAENARLVLAQLVERYRFEDVAAESFLDEVAEKSREIVGLFDIDADNMQTYSQLLQQANDELVKMNLNNNQLILELLDAKKQNNTLIHKLQDANARLKELVYQDGLTGLYNHRYFQEALEQELNRAMRYRSSVSLVLFDIDNFKHVNDTYGHLAGDMVLMNIARAVSGAIRTNDIVARFGGDEFAIILPSTNSDGVKTFAKHLRSCVEGIATDLSGQWIYVTISVGATSVLPEAGKTTRAKMIEAADQALYLSKQGGRNQVQLVNLKDS